MQIILNSNEVAQAVQDFIQSRFGLDDSSNYNVEAGDDGSFTIFVDEDHESSNESTGNEPAQTGEKPARKTRRTKAQIEADNKAEADRLAQAQASASTNTDGEAGTTSGEVGQTGAAPVTGNVEVPVETGTETAEELPLDQAGETGLVEGGTEVAGEAPANTGTTQPFEEQAENAEETPAPTTPARSLFAGLRTPKNPQ